MYPSHIKTELPTDFTTLQLYLIWEKVLTGMRGSVCRHVEEHFIG